MSGYETRNQKPKVEAQVIDIHKRRVQAELLGEEILTAREQTIQIDKKRQANREALAAIRKLSPTPSSGSKGDVFIKLPRRTVEKQIRIEQKQIDTESDDLRNQMKKSMLALSQLEEDTRVGVKPFLLQPIHKKTTS